VARLSQMKKRFVKALRASPHELRVRAAQSLFTQANGIRSLWGSSCLRRDGHWKSLGIWPNDLQEWWSNRDHRWFNDQQALDVVKRTYEAQPEQRGQILRRANELVNGMMPILSGSVVPFNGEYRWHTDHILHTQAPMRFYGAISYLTPGEVGDVRRIWDPSRFGWM
jgi:hypothetical protein